MQIYLVGGAVRDKLLARPVTERDYVVVGASASELEALGYQRVGKSFPVFLHPETREEYALARKERKVAPGYTGFHFDVSSDVTLEEDLCRRDLTINAIAECDDGTYVDPYGGCRDLKQKYLRHVSPAFVEDPLRVLRVARFAARYHHLGFVVAEETLSLMRTMAASGELSTLLPERVQKELMRALSEPDPHIFFATLRQVNALAIVLPECVVVGSELPHAIDSRFVCGLKALSYNVHSPRLYYASLCLLICALSPKPEPFDVMAFSARLRVSKAMRKLAQRVVHTYSQVLQAEHLSAEALVALFVALDGFRDDAMFHESMLIYQHVGVAINTQFSMSVDFLLELARYCQTQTKPAMRDLSGHAAKRCMSEWRLNCVLNFKRNP